MQAIGADANDWDKHFVLMADIDLGQFTGSDFNIIGNGTKPFTGVFDGNDHAILNFTYNSNNRSDVGLFRYVSGPNAEIKNLGLIEPNVADVGTGSRVGSLVGHLEDGIIANCYVEGGSISGDTAVGGLLGSNYGRVSDCHSSSSVSGKSGIGGLVGENGRSWVSGVIENCYSTGDVRGSFDVGGLVGGNRFDGSKIANCYSTADVHGDFSVGGLVGNNDFCIFNCYSTGSITGSYYIGGLTGDNSWDITKCSSISDVNGQDCVGGLVGLNRGRISNCNFTGDVGGSGDCVGGLVGMNGIAGTASQPFTFVYNSYSTASVSGRYSVGGLVGDNRAGTISNGYATGDVTGESWVGGLAGTNGYWIPYVVGYGMVSKCYAIGHVSGARYVGGLVGYNESIIVIVPAGDIEFSFWDIETSGEPNMCGAENYIDIVATGCDNSYGKTTAEMHQQSTFQDWDFINIWNIGENQTYPYLRTVPAGDINKDRTVNFLDVCIIAEKWCNEE